MRRGSVAPTLASTTHHKPTCKGGHSGNDIIRLHGRWVCRVCLKVDTTKGEQLSVTDIFPNRRARRASRAT